MLDIIQEFVKNKENINDNQLYTILNNRNTLNGVYLIHHIKTNKYYISNSNDIFESIRSQMYLLKNNKHYNKEFQLEYNGNNKLLFYLIITDNKYESCLIEKHALEKYQNSNIFFNKNKGIKLIDNNDIYKDYIIYGPYKAKDNRLRVILKHKVNNTKKTLSYPKYLAEVYIKKDKLHLNETVHHIDENVENNELNNFEILFRDEHVRKHNLIYINDITYNCIYCDKEITLTPRQQKYLRSNTKNKNKTGPFCSRVCSGKYGADVQNNRLSKE